MAHSMIVKCCDTYRKARTAFVDEMLTLAKKDDPSMVDALVDVGVIPLLCCPLVQDVVPSVQIASLGVLSTLSASQDQLAQTLSECGVLDNIVLSLSHESRHVRKAGNQTLQSIAGKNLRCANSVIAVEDTLPQLRKQLEDFDMEVKEAAVKTLGTLAKSSEALAGQVIEGGTLGNLVHALEGGDSPGARIGAVLNSVLSLGHISSFTYANTDQVVQAGGVSRLLELTASGVHDTVRAAAAWAIHQVALHGRDCVQALAAEGALLLLLDVYSSSSSQDAQAKAKGAVKAIIGGCNSTVPLEPLLALETPPDILQHVYDTCVKCLTESVSDRRSFVTS